VDWRLHGGREGFGAFDNPTECSGPPHLLGPWGSAGLGAVRVASSWHRSRPATLPVPANALHLRKALSTRAVSWGSWSTKKCPPGSVSAATLRHRFRQARLEGTAAAGAGDRLRRSRNWCRRHPGGAAGARSS